MGFLCVSKQHLFACLVFLLIMVIVMDKNGIVAVPTGGKSSTAGEGGGGGGDSGGGGGGTLTVKIAAKVNATNDNATGPTTTPKQCLYGFENVNGTCREIFR
ncbi:hypothetical protein ABEB36_004561 [Hypothenemus hampei]|uniref:Uncharacterized protein n=1 Tax=Hypothenemus hampei TaxID=57062 RepID=A0ABD1F3P8_HYPHA